METYKKQKIKMKKMIVSHKNKNWSC